MSNREGNLESESKRALTAPLRGCSEEVQLCNSILELGYFLGGSVVDSLFPLQEAQV